MDWTKQEEYLTVDELNKKRVGDLNNNLREIIHFIFPNANDDQIISCDICNRYSKPDFYISIADEKKYISLKSGRSDSVHFESIKSFVQFLRKCGVSERVLKIIVLFHYGDGTLDGSGKKRYLLEELMPKMRNLINEANEELSSKETRKKALRRFVFDGDEYRNISVDYILYGDKNYFVYCSKNELEDFVLGRRCKHINTLHIGPMTIQPYLRDVNRRSRHPEKRQMVQIKWHYLLSDMERIRSGKTRRQRSNANKPFFPQRLSKSKANDMSKHLESSQTSNIS